MTGNSRHLVRRVVLLTTVVGTAAACAAVVWFQLAPSEEESVIQIVRQHPSLIVPIWVFLLFGLALLVHLVFRHYIDPIERMTEEVELITTTNPSHRLTNIGKGSIARLEKVINEAADQFQKIQNTVNEKIRQANSELEQEKNTLAALLQELTEGVLVCNTDGQILLYNKRARLLLTKEETTGGADQLPGGLIGLGRSIFGLIDRNLIVHALEELAHKQKKRSSPPVSHFITNGAGGALLRVQAVPLLDHQEIMNGYVLVLSDITQRMEHDARRDKAVQLLTEGIRSSVTNIRAAVEAIDGYPSMDVRQRERLVKVIREESVSLSDQVEHTTKEYSKDFETQWPLEETLCTDLLAVMKRSAEQTLDVHIALEETFENLWVRLDSFSMLQALLSLMSEMKRATGVMQFVCRATRTNQFINVDLMWKGKSLPPATLREWEEQPLLIKGHGLPATLRDVLQRHNAELWSQAHPDQKTSYIRLLLPTGTHTAAEEALQHVVPVISRPEFYDFDLFQRPDRDVSFDDQPLAALTYTAFDTETTGLNPSAGDEIISLGAVRIVNRRLLRDDVFDQLVDPKRRLSRESSAVHGIQPEMLEGQLTIDRVLPAFQKFAEGTILVAHNAAFDMRFFQLKETSTGVTLRNPVLDTLLLSAVVHPNQEGHNLEEIAERLGINIIGRHTALGDAIVTGEVFLKLMQLLSERGIRTLQEAHIASKKTYYARLKY